MLRQFQEYSNLILKIVNRLLDYLLLINLLWVLDGASLVAQWQRIHLPMQEMWVQFLDQEDPLEEEMATHSSILAWEIPRTEEPSRLQFMWLQKSQTWLSD